MESLSIVIPCFNESEYIEESLESVFAQSFKELDIIVIDDGSSDDLKNIINNKYSGRVRYYYQENKGSAAARNRGIRESRGQFIAFLDADDVWIDSNKLEEQYNLLRNDASLGCVQTGWCTLDENGNKINSNKFWERYPELDTDTWLSSKCFLTSASMFRRSWLERANGFDETLKQAHDIDLILRLALMGCQTKWLKKECVGYRRHKHNTTNNGVDQSNSIIKVLDKFYSQPDLPLKIKANEKGIRYSTYVWQAWWNWCQLENVSTAVKLLKLSLTYTSRLKAEIIGNWISSFSHYSKEHNISFSAKEITDSHNWRQLSREVCLGENVSHNHHQVIQEKIKKRENNVAVNATQNARKEIDKAEQVAKIFKEEVKLRNEIENYRKINEDLKDELAEIKNGLDLRNPSSKNSIAKIENKFENNKKLNLEVTADVRELLTQIDEQQSLISQLRFEKEMIQEEKELILLQFYQVQEEIRMYL